MLSNILYYIILMFESVIGIFGLRLYEEPSYVVMQRLENNIEIRRYPERLAAEVELSANNKDKLDEAFRLLFAYIAGANHNARLGSSKIERTAPVQTDVSEKIAMTVPIEVSENPKTIKMRFYLPAKFNVANTPDPIDKRVRIVSVPVEVVATLRYAGNNDRSDSRQSELIKSLHGTQWRPSGAPYWLSYDPPFTIPFLRRNEVAVTVVETR
jgi:hypothetical protein